MKYYAGLDVSVKETSVCIVDESGKLCREKKVVTHPVDLVEVLSEPALHFERIGLEAGPLSQWLFEGLAKAGFAVLCIETRHTKALLKAQQPNKSDRKARFESSCRSRAVCGQIGHSRVLPPLPRSRTW